jgi:hypothetical protein
MIKGWEKLDGTYSVDGCGLNVATNITHPNFKETYYSAIIVISSIRHVEVDMAILELKTSPSSKSIELNVFDYYTKFNLSKLWINPSNKDSIKSQLETPDKFIEWVFTNYINNTHYFVKK